MGPYKTNDSFNAPLLKLKSAATFWRFCDILSLCGSKGGTNSKYSVELERMIKMAQNYRKIWGSEDGTPLNSRLQSLFETFVTFCLCVGLKMEQRVCICKLALMCQKFPKWSEKLGEDIFLRCRIRIQCHLLFTVSNPMSLCSSKCGTHWLNRRTSNQEHVKIYENLQKDNLWVLKSNRLSIFETLVTLSLCGSKNGT